MNVDKQQAGRALASAAALALVATPAFAGEIITYGYDAKGRLVQVTHSGTVNNGTTTLYTFDRADNRTGKTTTGAGAAGAATVADGGFEQPPQNGGWTYGPSTPGATFSSSAGVTGNNGAWGFGAPEGVQAAYIQGAGTVSLSVTGLTPNLPYQVNFWIAQRPAYGANPITVTFAGGPSLGTFTPASTSFTPVTSAAFTPSGTSGTVTFTGTVSAADITSRIDAVTVTPTSIPAATVADPSFETPVVNGYAYSPPATGLSFAGGGGIARCGGAFGFTPAPDGDQVGFLQSNAAGTSAISQAVSGLVVGQQYRVRFKLAGRPGYSAASVAVSFAGTPLNSGTASFTPTSTAFVEYIGGTFVAAATSGTLTFAGGAAPDDRASALDTVIVEAVQ
jgi:YD repeat-containing protein